MQNMLAIIPARSGSKGLPGKNIRTCAGKPLIAWTIEAALNAAAVSRVVVSTDDQAIAEIATKWGAEVPFLRPGELASDQASSVDVMMHALTTLQTRGPCMLLQPTSPLRTARDIDACVMQFESLSAQTCVSVVAVEKSPRWMYSLDAAQRLEPLLEGNDGSHLRRQDLKPLYAPNGAIYVFDAEFFLQRKAFIDRETTAYVMPAERSIDIDTAFEFTLCEFILSHSV